MARNTFEAISGGGEEGRAPAHPIRLALFFAAHPKQRNSINPTPHPHKFSPLDHVTWYPLASKKKETRIRTGENPISIGVAIRFISIFHLGSECWVFFALFDFLFCFILSKFPVWPGFSLLLVLLFKSFLVSSMWYTVFFFFFVGPLNTHFNSYSLFYLCFDAEQAVQSINIAMFYKGSRLPFSLKNHLNMQTEKY